MMFQVMNNSLSIVKMMASDREVEVEVGEMETEM